MDRGVGLSWEHCKKQVIEVVHQLERNKVTISLCHMCNVKYLGLRSITDAQFTRILDSYHDNKEEIKKQESARHFLQATRIKGVQDYRRSKQTRTQRSSWPIGAVVALSKQLST